MYDSVSSASGRVYCNSNDWQSVAISDDSDPASLTQSSRLFADDVHFVIAYRSFTDANLQPLFRKMSANAALRFI